MPHDAEIMALRLARMKFLIERLESACAGNADQRDILLSLTMELEAVRTALKLVDP